MGYQKLSDLNPLRGSCNHKGPMLLDWRGWEKLDQGLRSYCPEGTKTPKATNLGSQAGALGS